MRRRMHAGIGRLRKCGRREAPTKEWYQSMESSSLRSDICTVETSQLLVSHLAWPLPPPMCMPRPSTISITCTRACLDCVRTHTWLAGWVCRICARVCIIYARVGVQNMCQHREMDLEAVDVSLNHVAALGVKVECLVETCQRLV